MVTDKELTTEEIIEGQRYFYNYQVKKCSEKAARQIFEYNRAVSYGGHTLQRVKKIALLA